jgi:septum formation protein
VDGPWQAPEQVVLASGSPQRRAILEQLGVELTVETAEIEELTEGEPRRVVTENALRKARAVAGRRGAHESVLGADTAVVLDGRIFGKPRSEAEAATFIGRLSGRTHEVHSALALLHDGNEHVAASATRVRFRLLERAAVDWYLASGEWRERAGGYAIQGRGAALVERIDGDYWTVVGLPVPELVRLAPGLFRR